MTSGHAATAPYFRIGRNDPDIESGMGASNAEVAPSLSQRLSLCIPAVPLREFSEAYSQFSALVSPHLTKGVVASAFAVNILLTAAVGAAVASSYTPQKEGSGQNTEKNGFNYIAILAIVLPALAIAIRSSVNSVITEKLKLEMREKLVKGYHAGHTRLLIDHSNPDLHPKDAIFKYAREFTQSVIPFSLGTIGNSLDLVILSATSARMGGAAMAACAGTGAILFAASLMALNNCADKPRKKLEEAFDNGVRRLEYAEHRKQPISTTGGNDYELGALTNIIKEHSASTRILEKYNFAINLVNLAGLFVYPAVLAGLPYYPQGTSQSTIMAFSTRSSFMIGATQSMIGPLLNNRVLFMKAMKELSKFQAALKDVKDFNESRPLTFNYSAGDTIKFEGLSIALPAPAVSSEESPTGRTSPATTVEGSVVTDSTSRSLLEKAQDILSKPEHCRLHDADLELQQEKTYQFIGRSGCGKSTLFRACIGAWPYAKGVVNFPCREDEIYSIPQEPYIPYNSTLAEVLTYPPDKSVEIFSDDKKTILPEHKERITALMQRLGLERFIPELDNLNESDKKNWNFSRGEQQRIAIIRAAMSEVKPKLLFMDEPTASVDAPVAKVMWKIIREEFPTATIFYIDHTPEQNAAVTVSVNPVQEPAITPDFIVSLDAQSKKFTLTTSRDRSPPNSPDTIPAEGISVTASRHRRHGTVFAGRAGHF